jgi:hypothetical protein
MRLLPPVGNRQEDREVRAAAHRAIIAFAEVHRGDVVEEGRRRAQMQQRLDAVITRVMNVQRDERLRVLAGR